jgi:hypothetical protein
MRTCLSELNTRLNTWLTKLLIVVLLVAAMPAVAEAQSGERWVPKNGQRWMFQNYETTLQPAGLVLDTDGTALVPEFVVIPLYSSDPDVEPLTEKQIAGFHERNIRVVCSVVAGYWDRNAPDSDAFAPAMIGRSVWGDDDRRWVDVRNSGVRDLMAARIARAASIGCDAIDASYLELWYQNTGFFITYGDQLAFNRYLADSAHAVGVAIALHNTSQQIHDLVGWYDFAIVEGCLEAGECMRYTPFQALGKPVFHVEYTGMTAEMHVCNAGRDLGFNTLIKDRAVDSSARAC